MKKTFAICFLWFSVVCIAQKDKVYTLSSLATANKDSVFKIDLSKNHLTSLPTEIYRCKNLTDLNLSKNKIEMLGDSLSVFQNLRSLNLAHNKLKAISYGVFTLTSLTNLSFASNQIEMIPDEITYCQKLETIDFYDNAIVSISNQLKTLPALKSLDLRGVMYGHVFHRKIKDDFKHCKILIDPPCSCMD